MSELLPRQLNALLAQNPPFPFEVVVVDNGSTDGSRQIAEEHARHHSNLRVVVASTPGLNVARNRGVDAASAPIVALCDADDEVQPGWLTALHDASDEGCYLGGALSHGGPNSPAQRRRWAVDGDPSRVPRYVMGGVATPAGANCSFTKRMWTEIGGFDETISGAGDETEFFARAGKAGYRYVGVPTAVVGYRLPGTLRAVWRRGFSYGRNSELVLRAFLDGQGTTPVSRSIVAKQWIVLMLQLPEALLRGRGFYRWIHLVAKRTGRASLWLRRPGG